MTVLIVGLGAAAAVVLALLRERPDAEVLALLAFFAVLPLINGVFDFLSIGLTRFALRRGAERGGAAPLLGGLADLLGAAALFLLLGVAAISAFHALRLGDGAPILDLAALFEGILSDPHAYWWLYATFFSTLLPTALHLTAICFSAFALVPPNLFDFARRQLDAAGRGDGEGHAHLVGALALLETVCWCATIAAVWTLLWAVTTLYPDIAWFFFELLAAYAEWIGALPDGWTARLAPPAP